MQRRSLAVPAVLVVAVAAVCVRLGFWQLDRLEQRRAANEVVSAALAHATVSVAALGDSAPPWRRVSATGSYDFQRQVVIVNRARHGQPGVVVATPLRLADGDAILVERGWLPAPDAATVDLARYGEADSATVVGLVVPRLAAASGLGGAGQSWPLRVVRVDPVVLAARYPYPLRPYALRQLPDTALPDLPRRLGPPEPSDGPHLAYAVQWFSFAAIFLVGFAAFARRWRRSGA